MALLHWINNQLKLQIKMENELKSNFPDSKYANFWDIQFKKKINIDSLKKSDTLRQVQALKSFILQSNWDCSQDLILQNKIIPVSEKVAAMTLIAKGYKIKKRSPFVGGLLSTFIPGLGKIYANEVKDGILSFVFSAVSAVSLWRVSTYNGLNSPWTYTLGGISAGFYLGNIYGSVQSVKKYNKLKSIDLNQAKYEYFLEK